jgi:hypothetical protein
MGVPPDARPRLATEQAARIRVGGRVLRGFRPRFARTASGLRPSRPFARSRFRDGTPFCQDSRRYSLRKQRDEHSMSCLSRPEDGEASDVLQAQTPECCLESLPPESRRDVPSRRVQIENARPALLNGAMKDPAPRASCAECAPDHRCLHQRAGGFFVRAERTVREASGIPKPSPDGAQRIETARWQGWAERASAGLLLGGALQK